MRVRRNVVEAVESIICSFNYTTVEIRLSTFLNQAKFVKLLTPLKYKSTKRLYETVPNCICTNNDLFVTFMLYLLFSAVEHVLLLFAAMFESLLHSINGLCLMRQPLVACTWQALDTVAGTKGLVATQ